MSQEQMQSYLIDYTVDRMTEFLFEDYSLPIDSALNFIYNSKTYQKLINTENGLFEQSAAYVYELLSEEFEALPISKKETTK